MTPERWIIAGLVYHLFCCWAIVFLRLKEDRSPMRPGKTWRIFLGAWMFPPAVFVMLLWECVEWWWEMVVARFGPDRAIEREDL